MRITSVLGTLALLILLGGGCGKSYTIPEDVGNAEVMADLIVVTSPQPNDVIASPLTVTGEARGTWYFEATFPVRIIDGYGNTIATGYAEADGEWKTEDFVPFTSTLTFTGTPATTDGTLILAKDNPSDLPKNDAELYVPVNFE